MTPATRNPSESAPGTCHHHPVDKVAALLRVEPSAGLDEHEAGRRLDQYGRNRMTARGGPPAWKRMLLQFHQPLIYILLVASLVSGVLREWVDAFVIFAVVVINAVVGFIQEGRAGKAIASLARMIRTSATVRREGVLRTIDSELLVPGDVVLLEAGHRVPADLRLFRVRNLQVDESALTGESLPVHKQGDTLAEETVLADRRNTAYAGTTVTAGEGEGIVWATGDRTETGRIAFLISRAVELATPLTRKISQFSRFLLGLIIAIAAAAFAIGIFRQQPMFDTFMAAVAIAVAAIPEGLPAAVTIVLAIGVARMARRQVIIRQLPAVETLGSTTVICSDKTGTLTENQMTVSAVFTGGRQYEVTGSGYAAEGEIRLETRRAAPDEHPALAECLRAGILCNDAVVTRRTDGTLDMHGDPTEAAMVVAGEKAGMLPGRLRADTPRLDAIPFESAHMYRATLHPAGSQRVIYKVGAGERLIDRCSDMIDAHGMQVPIDTAAIREATERMAASGLRVLAIARRAMPPGHATIDHNHVARGLTFLGLQGMMDPPRPEVIDAIRQCRDAGISVRMITGDHLTTARTIAARIGLGDGRGSPVKAMAGRDLESLSDAELESVAAETTVFARVAPEQKLRLVRALQARGHVVAMTGDGVNDAPALRQADIGVAMGIAGTDVAKEAAAMIITDDNFASIVAAVEEGRGVFDNLTKFIVWTLPTNAAEALMLISAVFLGLTLPALPVHLLWINLTTALFLGLTIVFEPREPAIMQRPPRDPRRPLLTFQLAMRTGLVSLIMAAGGYWVFWWDATLQLRPVAEARTAVVNVIVFVEIAYLLCCRSLIRPAFTMNPLSNPWLLWGIAGMVLAQVAFTHAAFMNRLFHTAPISPGAWGRVLVVAIAAFIAVEFEKWLRFGRRPVHARMPE